MKPVLEAINTFMGALPYPSQRDVAPNVADNATYVVWSVLDDLPDSEQANYASEVQGAEVYLRIAVWAEAGGDAASAHDVVEGALRATKMAPVGLVQIQRPRRVLTRPVRDQDGRHHQVVSEWYLRFTKG